MNFVKRGDDARISQGHRRGEEIRHILLSLGVMLAMVAVMFLFDIPNPNMLLITGLSVFTSLYGYAAGVTCGVVMVVYSMFFFSTDHSFFSYSAVNLQKMAVIVLGVTLNIAFIGNLKRQYSEAERKMREMNCYLRDDNRSLESISQTDALTGVRNRYALRRDYNRFENRYLHVMMLDLDNFKDINDRYGHAMGDFALKKAGQMLRECFGEECCYRFGGDEFLVINGDIDESVFLRRMNDLKHGLKHVRMEGRICPVHFSAGYVYGDCELSFDLRMMMHQADVSLYEAKGMGKNCYVGRAFVRTEAGTAERERLEWEWNPDEEDF